CDRRRDRSLPGQRLLCFHAQPDLGRVRRRRRPARPQLLCRGLCDLQHCLCAGADGGQQLRLGGSGPAELVPGVALCQRGPLRLHSAVAAAPVAGAASGGPALDSVLGERFAMTGPPADYSPALLRAALDRGESLPARWYTDPSITAAETAQIFRRSWNYI